MHNKPFLPSKICVTCNKPFNWRKKWQLNWQQVRYCSERCRRHKATSTKQV
ncbi:DUF2256 domain-containing protein [Psychromonas sp. 14N.309.X.WAT.B.A12]|nr:DUF2256 domain-containing protein [Psychromonas sp. 14N.309.X.WAT.B.A12]MDN2662077.1 DUF2256 domain-containing protein [Psychromonas sp. 14N.309.X.WAT.B.A12]